MATRKNFQGNIDARRIDATTRQEGRATVSDKEQLGVLDRRLGAGVGATKERARLQQRIFDVLLEAAYRCRGSRGQGRQGAESREGER